MGSRSSKISSSDWQEITNSNNYTIKNSNEQVGGAYGNNGADACESVQWDPRSPAGNRTPLNLSRTAFEMNSSNDESTQFTNPLGVWRKRILKSFGINLSDPRSPSTSINRTPLVINDPNDKVFNMNDTFADLFVESRRKELETRTTVEKADISIDIENEEEIATAEMSYEPIIDIDYKEEKYTEPNGTPSNVTVDLNLEKLGRKRVHMDPRSPSLGVDRTPIIFSDVDDSSEDAMLENILAVLSHDLSCTDSLVSTTSTPNSKYANAVEEDVADNAVKRPTDKRLERVRYGKKYNNQPKPKRGQNQNIFEDSENSPVSTPNKSKLANAPYGRLPLSSVGNRSQILTDNKSVKPRLMNFDDIYKEPNVHTAERSDDVEFAS